MKLLRLWLAIKLLGFMHPNDCLVRALRSDGQVQWDGGRIIFGQRVVPIGLSGLIEHVRS